MMQSNFFKNHTMLVASIAVALFLTGCATPTPSIDYIPLTTYPQDTRNRAADEIDHMIRRGCVHGGKLTECELPKMMDDASRLRSVVRARNN